MYLFGNEMPGRGARYENLNIWALPEISYVFLFIYLLLASLQNCESWDPENK